MATMITTNRSARLLEKVLAPVRRVAARRLSTSAAMRDVSDEDEERETNAVRRGDWAAPRRYRDPFAAFFTDGLEPFYPTRSVSQVLNLMDQLAASSREAGAGRGLRRWWDAREDADALHLRVDMPGLGKEHVKVTLEENTLVIRGEGEKDPGGGESGPGYSSRIDLPPEVYKLDQIRAEMKNGVLKVVVPKAKEEERQDAVEIQIE